MESSHTEISSKQEVINVLDIFPELNQGLIELLEGFSQDEWEKETCLKGRSVKDLVSHLIDTSLRRLAMDRDHYFSEAPEIHSREDLVEFIQSQNRDWILATRRLSPNMLLSLLKSSGDELVDFLGTLELHEKALFPVDWAGESQSENWFDIAREYTEKWHHQMQIRDAVGREGPLYETRFFQPIIDSFIKALPVAFNQSNRAEFTVAIEITGTCGGTYFLEKKAHSTGFVEGKLEQTSNRVKIDQKEFCKLVTNSKLKEAIEFEAVGDSEVTNQLLLVVAVMS
ncbi:maleylpyruvate isomerase N-terminal domain-containing protein [Photobacterium sanctipauli]|nr:maleylpyruvate isomerase N-terminal domain-containing protein [Photobacterium sanctipauli]